MARFRTRSSRTRSTTSRSWLKSVLRFRRRFPRLLRGDFWRSDAVDALWPSLFRRKKRKPAEKRRRSRQTGASGWAPSPIAFRPEALEARAMLTSSPAGFLDHTFNLTGTNITTFGASHGAASAVAYNSTTGDTIVVGTSANKFALAAYKPDGTLDASFGVGGLATLSIGVDAIGSAVAIDSGGRILVAGSSQPSGGNYDFAVACFTSSGSLDTTFASPAGYATQNITGTNADFASAITIESSGRIVLAGKTQPSPSSPSSQAHSAFAAFTSTGVVDTSFNGTGVVFTTGAADFATAVTHDASDNVLAVGQTAVVSATHAELITMTATGGGVTRNTVNLSIPGSGSGDVANDVVPVGTKFLIAGAADGEFVLAKVDSSGNLDTSFNSGGSKPGEIETAIGTSSEASAVVVQSDGRIVVAGSATQPSGHNFFAVARYKANGTLDTGAFGSPNGYVTTDFTGGDSDSSSATGAVIEPDGKIIVAGTTNINAHAPGDFAVARYIANNAPTIANTTGTFTEIDTNETSSPNLGDTVASLLSQLGPSDVDGNTAAQFGLAVVATDSSNGTWQYSTDGGSTWSPIVAASGTNALLLAQMTGGNANRIRFAPAADYIGLSSITVRAWDETQGTSGSTDNVTSDQANYLNAYSDSTAALTIHVVQPSVVYVNAAWAGSTQGQTVSGFMGSHTFGIDAFATIPDGVNLVASGGTVHINSGTYYQSNLVVSKPETIVGISESGVIVAPASVDSHDDSNFGGTPDNAFVIGASGVTIEDLTIDGNANNSLAGSFNFRMGVVTNATLFSGSTYDNTVLDHLTVKDVFRKGIGLYNAIGNTTSVGNQITNSTFDAVGTTDDSYEGTSAIAAFNSNTLIDSNVITNSSAGILGNYSSLLTITNNQISSPLTAMANGALGIDVGSAVTGSSISSNIIHLTGSGTAHNDIGIVVSFVNGSVTVSSNQITATGSDDGILLYQDTLSGSPVQVSGNTMSSDSASGSGILLAADALDTGRFGDVPGDVYATISGGSITGFARGVSLTSSGDAVQATIDGGIQIHGSTYGVIVQGATATATINSATIDPQNGVLVDGGHASIGSGVTISGSTVGVSVQNSGTADISGAHIYGNLAGVFFTTHAGGSLTNVDFTNASPNAIDLDLDTDAGTVTDFGGNKFDASGAYVIDNSPQYVDATGDTFSVGSGGSQVGGNSLTIAQAYAAEDKITDGLDLAGSAHGTAGAGLVRIVANAVFVAHSSETVAGSIQRAIDLADAGPQTVGDDSIYVQAGTYTAIGAYHDPNDLLDSEININKSLTLLGPNAAYDPNVSQTPANAQAIILPGAVQPHYDNIHALSIIGITASNVTIEGFTINGDNEALNQTGSISYNGANIDVFEGISSYVDAGHLTIGHNIVKNAAYTGVDLNNGNNSSPPSNNGLPTSNNDVSYNLVQNIGDGAGYGTGVYLANNAYATVTHNVMSAVLVGVQTQNFTAANPGGAGTAAISNNTIASVGAGIWYNASAAGASPFSIVGNTITDPHDAHSGLNWDGILVTGVATPGVTIQNNSIDGSGSLPSQTSAAYDIWGVPTPAGLVISGGNVTGAKYGVWVNTYEGLPGNAGPTQVEVSGVSISATQIGVYVEDSPAGTHPLVSATIDDGTTITTSPSNGGVGVEVSGSQASAIINGATINDPLYGVEINGGSAQIYGSLIENNGTGIYVHGGGSATVGSATPGDGNTISANGIGIQVGDGTTGGGVTATRNTLSNDTTGIKVDIGTLVADNNLISGGSGDSVLVAADGTPSVTLSGNELANTGLGVNNQNAAAVNASKNYWGAPHMTEAALFAKTAGSVDYTPWFDLSTNNAVGTGFVGDPSALDVGSGGAQTGASGRIGEAVADVPTGGTIKVFGANGGIGASGVYVEQVAITKNLTLFGTDEATTIIRSPASLATSFTTSAPNKAVVFVNGATVDINHLTIDGNLQGSGSNYRFIGLAYYDASGTADHLTIENVSDNPFDGLQSGNGYYAFNDAGAHTITVSNSDVFAYQKNGITANGVGLTASITGNTVTGQNASHVNGQNGIQIGFGALGHVSGNTVSNNKFDTSDTEAAGILLYQAATGTTVVGNTVTGSDNGVAAVDSNATVDSNILTGNTIGVMNDGFDNPAALVITNNEISGGDDGIQLYDDITGTTIHNNFIRTNTGTGILVDSSVADSSGPLHVNDNFIAGNATAGINNKSSVTVDATVNWWGTANGPTAAGNTYNIGHQGDKIIGSGVTNYVPWLNDGTDTSADPGFQPNATTFAPVTDVTPGHFGQFSSIQAAINAGTTMPGDHIVLAAGTFTENVDVTKSLTISGAGQGLGGTTVYSATSNPLGSGPGSLNGGSVIFLVDANNVTIDDLIVDGDNPQNGSGIDARDGIITDHLAGVFNKLNVNHVTVQNIYLRGIYASSGGTFDFEHDTVSNVQADPQSIAMFNFAGSGVMAFNTVSNANDAISANHSTGTVFHDNVITHSLSGIHTDNNNDGGGTPDQIYSNNVSLGGAGSYGIFVFVPYSNVSVHDNIISGVDVGLGAFGGQMGGSVAFANNSVSVNAGGDGAVVSTDTFGFGEMDVVASFSGDSFSGFSGGGDGILVQQLSGATATATITGVTVNDPTYGIEVDGGSASVSGSTIEHNDVGVYVHGGGSVTLSGNSITLNGIGVEIGSTGTLVSATGNRIDANTGDGIRIDSGATSVGAISNNDLSGNGGFAVDNQSGLTIDASLNWWGVNTESAVAAKTHGSVDYTPWFDNGTNSAAGPAFSGDFSKLDVGSGGAQVQAGGRINEAIGDLTAGGTIKVYDGTYTEDVLINKNLTLESANGAAVTTINDPISASVTVAANVTAATLDGFTIEAGSGEWALDILGSGVSVLGNIFESLGLGNVLAADGSNTFTGNTFTAPPVGSESNFEQYDDTTAGRENAGEITGILSANTFNRGVSVHDGSSNFIRTIWADIQPAINAASLAGGDTVAALAGSYAEHLTIDRQIVLTGAGSGSNPSSNTVIDPASTSNPVVSITGSGADASHRLTVQHVNISGDVDGVYFNSAVSHIALSDVIIAATSVGVEVHNAAAVADLDMDGVSVSTNTVSGTGFRVATTGVVNGLTITNSHFDNNQIGLYTNADNSTTNETEFTNILISGTTFNNDTLKGIYVEKLDHATLDNITVNNSGTGSPSPTGVNLNLKHGHFTSITIENSSFASDGTGTATGAAVTIDGRNDAPSYNSNPASVSGIVLSNLTFTGSSPIDLSIGDNVTGVSFSGVSLGGTGVGLVNFVTAADTLNIADTNFAASLAGYIINSSPNTVLATSATFGAVGPGDNTLADLYGVEDKIADAIDVSGFGLVRLRAGNVYVTPNSFFPLAGTTSPSIQRGADAASVNDIVNVEAGTYTTGVTVNKTLTFRGAGAGVDARTRSISETIINASGGAFGIHASNVVIDGFTLEGQSNDNSGPGFGYAVFMAPGVGGTQVLNNIVPGNHAGIAVSNVGATQAVIEQNLFRDNSSGLATDIYADQFTAGAGGVQNVLISENTFTNTSFVENAWGVGISNTGAIPFSNITVSFNTFSNSGRGMYFYNSTGVTIDANTVTGATHYAVGIFGDDSSPSEPGNSAVSITRNTLDGNGTGILVEGSGMPNFVPAFTSGTLNVANNYLDSNARGVWITSDGLANGVTVDVNINHIAGNTTAGLENDSSVNVNADYNWWGSASGPTNAANPGGTGDTIIDPTVTFSPWLTDGIDSDSGQPGFQHATTGASAVSISGSPSGVEGATYVLNLSPSSDITSWDINWGDGTQHVVGDPASVSHVYQEEGQYTISAVAHTTTSGDVNSNTLHVSIADAALHAGALTPPVATEGAHFTDIQLFHFTDDDPNGTASDYTATITWGDGTTSTVTSIHTADGQIVANMGGGFDVLGSHTYLEEATGLPFSVSVTDHSTYSNGFETGDTGTSDWTHFDDAMGGRTQGGGITVVSSGAGLLPPAPASGSNYAVVTNTPDTYDVGYGAGGYTFFGGPQKTYTGPFGQSVAIYINTAWAAPTNPGVPAFWLDMTPDHADPNNYGAEHNFRFYVDGSGTIKVAVDSDDPGTQAVATITQSGWYTFEMTYRKAASPTDPVLTDLNVYNAADNLVGSKTDVPATSPGGPFQSADLTGHGYAWLTVWQDGFANNELAIDNMNTEVFPISSSAPINVADADLTGSSAATATGGIEGFHTATLSNATFTDANPGDHTADFSGTINWGDTHSTSFTSADVSYDSGSQTYTVSGSHLYAEEGNYNITITVNDDGGKSTPITGTAHVVDAGLHNTSGIVAASGTEGASTSTVVVAKFTDDNPGDHSVDFTTGGGGNVTIHWGDTQTSTGSVSYDGMTGTYTVTGSHTYADEGVYHVTVDVTDDGGSTLTGIGQTTVTVNDANLHNTSGVVTPSSTEGASTGSVVVAKFTDDNPGDHSIDFTAGGGGNITIHWGDGNSTGSVSYDSMTGTYTVTGSHTYADEGVYHVTVDVTDDGASTLTGIGQTTVTVNDAALTGSNTATAGGMENQTNSSVLSGATFTDANPGDNTADFTATIHWGDTSSSPGTVSYDSMTHVYTVNGSHTYTTPGMFSISIDVADDGGQHATITGTANVAATFQVTGFNFNNSGFDVTFNRAADTSKLNLYRGDTLPPPPPHAGPGGYAFGPVDVTVVGQHVGAVHGSLVWDPSTNTAHFVVYRGALAADTYTITLASRSDGWTDLSGSLLDGLNNGHAGSGDYTHMFTITTPTVPVISLPSFARGPGQTLDVNADGTARTTMLPVHISDTTGVLSVDFELDYDPSLMTITTATFAPGWTGFENSPQPGQILVSMFRATANTTAGVDLVDFAGSVPMTAPYGASQLLKITNITGGNGILNEGGIGSVVDEAIEKVAYFGDASGNTALSGLDATLISRNTVHLDDGFTAYPLTDPRIIGDVTGDGTLSGLDASDVANAAVHNVVPTIPAVPAHGVLPMSALDPTVTVPQGVLADPGQTVNVPVSITDNAAGLLSADLDINYANSGIKLFDSGVMESTYLSTQNWGIAENVVDDTGEVFVSVYSTGGPLPTGMPQLLNLEFQVPANAAPGEYAITVQPSPNSQLNEDHLSLSVQNGSIVVVDPLTVLNTNDSGVGSLRQVINYANTLPGSPHTITFAIPAGPQTIQLLSPLPASTVPLVTQLDATQNVTVISPTGGGYDNFSALTKTGDGSLTLQGANSLTGNVEVDAGTLRFNDTVAPMLAPGITATASMTGTLDLSGFVSAFTGGASGNSIVNNSSATSGILISGTNQHVGNVDGAGNLSVNAGSDLTANHIIEKALVIGGTAGSPGLVTIDSSDASGNPLSAGGGGASANGASAGASSLAVAPAAPPLLATGTLSLLAVPLSSPASIQAATFISTASMPASLGTTSDAPALHSVTSAMVSSHSSASAGPTAAIGALNATIVATGPASTSVTGASQSSATDAQAFTTTSSGQSLDGGAVAALFDAGDAFEWLATGSDSQSSSGETAERAKADGLSDELLATIGQQWHS